MRRRQQERGGDGDEKNAAEGGGRNENGGGWRMADGRWTAMAMKWFWRAFGRVHRQKFISHFI